MYISEMIVSWDWPHVWVIEKGLLILFCLVSSLHYVIHVEHRNKDEYFITMELVQKAIYDQMIWHNTCMSLTVEWQLWYLVFGCSTHEETVALSSPKGAPMKYELMLQSKIAYTCWHPLQSIKFHFYWTKTLQFLSTSHWGFHFHFHFHFLYQGDTIQLESKAKVLFLVRSKVLSFSQKFFSTFSYKECRTTVA